MVVNNREDFETLFATVERNISFRKTNKPLEDHYLYLEDLPGNEVDNLLNDLRIIRTQLNKSPVHLTNERYEGPLRRLEDKIATYRIIAALRAWHSIP